MPRYLWLTLICGSLVAQQTDQQQPLRIVIPVENVVVPVTVYDHDGSFMSGLEPHQFHLYDNGKEQNIHVDVTFQPISMVIAIQANAAVESILPQVQKIGNLVSPLILGDQGEAAVLAFDSRLRTLQDFTSDPDKITKAVKTIYPGSSSSRMVDAVMRGAQMLNSRPKNRRRILLLISETRDLASENNAREALIYLQLANVAVYSVDMSRLVGALTAPTPVPRADNLPPAMQHMPGGAPATPTNVEHLTGANAGRAEFIPLMVEVFKDVKAIFKANPVELFTKGTGGREYTFYRLHGLEQAIQDIGEELHAEYLLSYSPNNKDEGGFHEISVQVGAANVGKIQARPGYWLAGRP